jgi:N-acetylmuramoyl-L-alanine amidase
MALLKPTILLWNESKVTRFDLPLPHSALRLAPLFVSVLLLGCSHRTKSGLAVGSVKDATGALERVSHGPEAVPDAVLNAARCLVTVPSFQSGAAPVTAAGVASCRDKSQSWSTPFSVTFEGRAGKGRVVDLLVLVLNDAAMRDLQSGRRLQINSSTSSPAPLVSTTPLPTQLDITRESISYEAAKGVLSSSDVKGTITRAARMPAPAPNIPGTLGKNDKYEAALMSLFTRIVPNGIVIHHTAVIPTGGALPSSTSDVDRYHETRGFEIVCEGRVYHVAYHYLVLPDGRVQVGRPERCEGAHARGYNSYLGISVVGDFSSQDNPQGNKGVPRPTDAQVNSLIRLCRELRTRYRIPLQHIVRHSDITSTQCPGDRFPFALLLSKLKDQVVAVQKSNR